MSNNKIYERNIHDLEEQLHCAWGKIDELNKIKNAAQVVCKENEVLKESAFYNPNKLSQPRDTAIEKLSKLLRKAI